MGISFSLKTRIRFNGKEYGSVDEMPDSERQTYEQAMAAVTDPAHAKGMIIRTQLSSKITLNGQEYDGVDSMPPDVRKTYDMAVAAMDANRPSAPVAQTPTPTVRSPLNRAAPAAADRASSGPRLSVVLLILGLLAGLIVAAVCFIS